LVNIYAAGGGGGGGLYGGGGGGADGCCIGANGGGSGGGGSSLIPPGGICNAGAWSAGHGQVVIQWVSASAAPPVAAGSTVCSGQTASLTTQLLIILPEL
jgi:hypothetical protein